MGTAMTNSFIKMSGTLSKETTVAYENARKEMMASAKRKIVFAQIGEARHDIFDYVIITSNARTRNNNSLTSSKN